tara:strand:- start:235 stop:480 length:246 start_codon:yes stop_codon:yes gene_type:complete
MADPKERIRPALMPTGFSSRERWTWTEIMDYLALTTGTPISRQRVQAIAYQALKKLRKELADDPLVRDWLENVGLQRPEDP